MAHLRFIDKQIKQIEATRLEQLKQAPQQQSNSKVLDYGVSMASALRQRICSPTKRSRAICAISALSPDTPASPAHPTRAAGADEKRASPKRATHGCVAV